jgi:uncharacterized protein
VAAVAPLAPTGSASEGDTISSYNERVSHLRLNFEFDPAKAASNLKKHGISFHEAMTVFADPLAATFVDETTLGRREPLYHHWTIIRAAFLFVSHCESNDSVRIIGARLANATEKKTYEESN